MALKLITDPEEYPVTLAQAKAHLRVDFMDEDALISSAIIAATRNAEQFTGRAFIDQTWDFYLDEFPCREIWYHLRYSACSYRPSHHLEIKIPFPPLIEVIGVYYQGANGVEQLLDAATYIADTVSEPGRIVPVTGWPLAKQVPNSVRVRFRAGFVDMDQSPTGDVPGPIKSAILLYVGDLYANRETMLTGQRAAVVQIPFSSEQLLRP